MDKNFEKVVSHVVNSGFVYQGSAIYGGLANTWDYGPLGTQLKMNLKNHWWRKFVQEEPLNVGLDSAILMNPRVWEASGHLTTFTDPLMDCKHCKSRHRADQLVESHDPSVATGSWTNEQFTEYIKKEGIKCPICGSTDFTDIRKFQLMFKTFQGVVEDSKSVVYLRPETAQGIFVNFKNVQRTTRKKVPFGIGQIGKSFRNEITPGNFIFRTREFEQMELEFFCKPGTDLEWFAYWRNYCHQFLLDLGIKKDMIRLRDHLPEELCFYSKATTDFEFKFFFGWGELWGVADRTDYDLGVHQTHSGVSFEYLDPETNEKYIPYVVEPSLGVERLLLAVLTSAYEEEQLEDGDVREVLRLKPSIAPVKVAVLPLVNKLNEKALEVYQNLVKEFNCEFDTSGKIGKRYRRQDAIGTPFCVTVDFDTLEDGTVTIRDRDTMQQERIKIEDLVEYVNKKIK